MHLFSVTLMLQVPPISVLRNTKSLKVLSEFQPIPGPCVSKILHPNAITNLYHLTVSVPSLIFIVSSLKWHHLPSTTTCPSVTGSNLQVLATLPYLLQFFAPGLPPTYADCRSSFLTVLPQIHSVLSSPVTSSP
jgi:hypothetical protein